VSGFVHPSRLGQVAHPQSQQQQQPPPPQQQQPPYDPYQQRQSRWSNARNDDMQM
jgi:hypothetical protein